MIDKVSTRQRVFLMALVVFGVAVALSACGSSSSSSSSESTGEGTSAEEGSGGSGAASSLVAEASEPQTEWKGPESGPPAATGKTVADISCSETSEGCVRYFKGFAEGAKAIGWNVKELQTNGTVQELNKAMEQAIAAHVDGIAVGSFPPAAMASQLKVAEKEGIPVLTMFSGEKPPKPQANFKGGYLTEVGPGTEYVGEVAASWIAENSGEEAEAGIINEEAFPIVGQYVTGFEKGFEGCSGCKLGEVINVPVANLASEGASATLQMLQSHPNMKYVFSYDGSLVFAAQAVRDIGREVTLVGVNGNTPNLEMIREGGPQQADVAEALEWAGWAAVDQFNRTFAGEPVAEQWTPQGNAISSRLITKENLPPKGQGYRGDLNYEKKFEELWGVG